jgi:hypothetical protein
VTVELTIPRRAVFTVAPPPTFVPHVRAMRADELPWVLHSWSQSYKGSRRCDRMTWAAYKELVVPTLRTAIARSDTHVLVCDGAVPGRGVGWLAWSRWPSIDTIHWIYVTHQYRRARSHGFASIGVMAALIEAAHLRGNIVYTHEGAKPHNRGHVQADLWIADWLRGHGSTVSHVPYKEWSK